MMIKNMRSLVMLLLAGAFFVQPVLAQQANAKPTTEQVGLGPTLSKIAATGIIYLAVSEASVPFSYVLPDRKTPVGYSWEICQQVVKAVEAKLGKPIQTVPVTVSTSGRMMMVKVGMADIECGSTGNTLGRQRQVAFSNTFFVSEVRVLVRADSEIKGPADLNGKKVVTSSGTNSDRLVKQVAIQRGMSVSQLIGRTNLDSMAMLERREADAFVGDEAILLGERANAKNPDQFVLLAPLVNVVEPYGLVLRNDDPVFKALVDETLVGLMKSGEIEKIYDRWFNQPIPPNNRVLNFPASELNKAAWAYPNDKPAN